MDHFLDHIGNRGISFHDLILMLDLILMFASYPILNH